MIELDGSSARLDEWRTTHLVLIGEMGAGKTTVGRMLAERLGRAHLDSDELIEQRLGVSVGSYADRRGVEALHELELQVFLDAISEADFAVISPAASVLDSEPGRDALRRHVVVWLDAPVDVSLERMTGDDHRRIVDVTEVEHLRVRRLGHYREVADRYLDTASSSPEELAERIVGLLNSP